ncbi:FHA domain-containing protein [Labilithrix luteola]|uniref:FHA domain-containing protein n=1 Tax=Labilithrix luteola TaxID=1391654 RepID=UPI0011BACD2C|nr:FHA domain-containing protein [Labilithrix luteola]
MARYRLRFLLQEFDLPRGATILGRSSDCHVTIEDPLVSRHHARIVLEGDRATVYDLNSRNGVKVNGVAAKEPVELKDGDRLRIGTQELVFCRVDAAPHSSAKTTGFLRHCARCRMPYPQEAGACPNCGATEALDEETLSGSFGTAAQQVWSVQLFVEVLERALGLERFEDIQRILRRATVQVEELLARGDAVDGAQLAKLAFGAVRASLTLRDPTWGLWVAQVYRRVPLAVPHDVVGKLGELAVHFPVDMAEPVEHLVAHQRTLPMTAENFPAVEALERVSASVRPALRTAKPS